jgi:hypothetical protein
MMPEDEILKQNKFSKIFNILIVGVFLLTILTNFYFLFFQKDYEFIVETTCDPSKEECFERDCTNPEDCPPNGLPNFKRYSLSAKDFKMCVNEDCTQACESGFIKCTQLECIEDPEWGESCVSPENIPNEEFTPESEKIIENIEE